MALICPNKNLKEWQQLVSSVGEDTATLKWYESQGDTNILNKPKSIQTLEKELIDGFLKDFNITVTEYNNLKEDLGIDSYTASDLITKSIAYQTGESILPEVAYFAYSMLGKQNNKLRSEMKYLINKWDKYQERFKVHAAAIKQRVGYMPKEVWRPRIQELVILDFLQENLTNYYQNPEAFKKQLDTKWTAEDFSTWEKIIKWIQRNLGLFRESKEASLEKLTNIATGIADEILTRNYTYYNYNLSEDQIKKYYNDTINTDSFAKSIVEFGQSLGIVLTGSLALRRAGTVYRTAEETLHDIDWVIPYDLVSDSKNISVLNKIIDQQSSISPSAAAKSGLEFVNEFTWFKEFKNKFPSFTFINSFYGVDTGYNSLTTQGVINGQFYEADGFHTEEVSYYKKDPSTRKPIKIKETKKVKHKKGDWIKDTGYVIDFFIRLTPHQEQHENYFKLWKEIMIAKIKMGRDKDFTDWKAFVPYLKSKDSFNFNYEGFRHLNYQSSENNALEETTPDVLFQTKNIKTGVAELFDLIPELASIGTPEQYSQYLDTIFPNSDVKDILYHGTNSDVFEKFDTTREKPKRDIVPSDGIFFSYDKEASSDNGFGASHWGRNIIASVVDVQNPEVGTMYNTFRGIRENKTSDSILGTTIGEENPSINSALKKWNTTAEEVKSEVLTEGEENSWVRTVVVFNQSQGHVLGNAQDIQGFKKFIKKTENPANEQKENLDTLFREFITINGGKIESVESLVDLFGGDYAAAYDALNKIVYLAKGKTDETTLPEELGHFIVDLLGEDHPLVKGLLGNISKLDYKTIMDQIDPEYNKIYKGDAKALKVELAGKLIGHVLLGKDISTLLNVSKKAAQPEANIFKRTIDKIKSIVLKMFSNSNEKQLDNIHNTIKNYTGEIAKKVINKEKIDVIPFRNKPVHPVFFQTKAERETKKARKEYLEQEVLLKRRVGKLNKELSTLIPNTTAYNKKKEDVRRLKYKLEELEATSNRGILVEEGNLLLSKVNNFISGLEAGTFTLDSFEEVDIQYAIEILNAFNDFEGTSDTAKRLRKRLLPFEEQYVEKVINESITNQYGKTLTMEDIEAQDTDIDRLTRYTGALSDVPNYIAATIGANIKEAQNRVTVKNAQDTNEVIAQIDALKAWAKKNGIAEKDIYKIFIQNYRGTTVLTKPYTTEFYDKLSEAFKKLKSPSKELQLEGKSWLKNNVVKDSDGYWIALKESYKNKNYQKIQNTPELKAFYDFHQRKTKEAFDKIPVNGKQDFIANIRKSTVETLLGSDKTLLGKLKYLFAGLIKIKEVNMTDFAADEDLIADKVPVQFVASIEADVKSEDLGKNLLTFLAFANNYEEMSEILPKVQLLKDIIAKGGEKFRKSSNPKLRIKGEATNLYNMIDDVIEMQVLGRMKKEELKLTIDRQYDADGNIVSQKYINGSDLLDIGLKFNSLLRIGINPINAFSNVFIGEIGNAIEAMGGRFFSLKNYNTASKIYFQNNFKKDSLVDYWIDKIAPLQELEDYENLNKVKLKGRLDSNKIQQVIYSPQSMGEKFMQSRLMLAVLLKEGVINEDGTTTAFGNKLTEQQISKLRDKTQRVVQMIHGRYSSRDAATAQQYALYRAVAQFRKWIPAAFESRFQKEKYDARLQEQIEGRYRTFGRMLLRLSDTISRLQKGKLTSLEVYNMKKNLMEATIFAGSLLLYYGLKGGEDDKEWRKKPLVKFSLTQLDRISGDLLFFLNPKEYVTLASTAAPLSKTANDLLQTIINIPAIFDSGKDAYYRSGPRKGEHKFLSRFGSIIPGVKPVQDVLRLVNDNEFISY